MSRWTPKEEDVRARLLEDGIECPLDDCDVIIQKTKDGNLSEGVSLHFNVVHDLESRDHP